MSRMKCVEEIYDVLVGAGLSTEHSSFDDLILGCTALATGEAQSDVVSYIEHIDPERDGTTIALDIYEYVRSCGCQEKPSSIVARAVAAGRVGWEQ